MKPSLTVLCFLASCSLLSADTLSSQISPSKPTPLVEELVRMTRAGASDATVLAYARAHRLELPPELSDADLRWLRESGVSPRVVSYMSAIDVRASDEPQQEPGMAAPENELPPVTPQNGNESEQETVPVNPSDQYAGGSSDVYPESYGDTSYPYFYDSYPWYGYWPYPYAFFAIANPFFFGNFCGHHHHHHHWNNQNQVAHHNDLGGHQVSTVARGGLRDAWRQRTPAGGRSASFAASRGPVRTVGPRGGSGPAYGRSSGRMVARGGFSRGPARAVSPRGVQSSRSFARPSGFSRPAFSSFPRGGGFGGASRGSAPRAMGSFGGSFGGSSGGRGRR